LRFSAGEKKKVLAILTQLQKDLRVKLLGDLTDFGKARVNKLLKESTAVIDAAYAEIVPTAMLELTPLAIEAQKYKSAEEFVAQYIIKPPKLTATQISNMAQDIDYGMSQEAIASLKARGEKFIDAYHVAKVSETEQILKSGIKRGASWYEREEMVYFFADPDDIRLAAPYLSLKVEGDSATVAVHHFKIPVSDIKKMEWDGMFNTQMETYSAFGIKRDIPKGWIAESKLFEVPSAEDLELNKFITKKQLTETWNNANATDDMLGLARSEAQATAQSFAAIGLDAALPTEAALKAMVNGSLIEGAPSAAWWSKQSDDTAFKFAAQVRQGIAGNETVQQIVRRVIGSPRLGTPGIMETSRRGATALVHTSIQQVANDARLATFKANDDVVKGVMQLSTLDSHTTKICIAYSGASWDLDGNPINGNTLPFNGGTPRHWNCRSVLTAITFSYKELGIDIPEAPPGTRASDLGQIPADTSFESFLGRHDKAYVDNLLGPGRADLWRDGKITLQQLVGGDGRELTLKRLKAL